MVWASRNVIGFLTTPKSKNSTLWKRFHLLLSLSECFNDFLLKSFFGINYYAKRDTDDTFCQVKLVLYYQLNLFNKLKMTVQRPVTV